MRIEKKHNELHFWLANGEEPPLQKRTTGKERIVIFRSGSENLQKNLSNLLKINSGEGK